ncbi:MAG: pyroglutamyl-peptidase I [Candidatus Thorarchaeota archaeon]|nr:MAG: pyroglutamyl-peptidase I [Candidatus Thorarchaeota archaeon]
MKVLVTGFEPFDGSSMNPSAEVAKSLSGRIIGGHDVTGVVLPLDYETALKEVNKHIEEHKPDVILCCGQAGRAAISIERIAVNAISTKRSDNQGKTPEQDTISSSGEVAYFTNLDPKPLVDALDNEGIPAFVSYHAGIYGCNWLIYNIMEWISSGRLQTKATFVHIPPLPEQAIEKSQLDMPTMALELSTRALEVIIEAL